ncbi:hypothetical protein ACXYL9_04475 [Qipengyuania sp. CAU 1752]
MAPHTGSMAETAAIADEDLDTLHARKLDMWEQALRSPDEQGQGGCGHQ